MYGLSLTWLDKWKGLTNLNVNDGVEESKFLYVADGILKCYNYFKKLQVWRFLINLNLHLSCDRN